MVGYTPGRVGYGPEEFRLESLPDCCIGFAGAAPQFNSITIDIYKKFLTKGSHRKDCRYKLGSLHEM